MLPTRAKKTLIGTGLIGLGLTIMFVSPYVALRLSTLARIPSYTGMYLCGFIALLYGTGQVLISNGVWGD